ncbi:MAG: PhzF family phenazine biosynthesis protein [Myxococcales bacterium]|nr:PhzF family phenazine biosynthesis protein [Polyangiaceae bacterium]MDW8248455.1 PhzF family phenazine biosynthesis protein [Myxococcales bacterium]
MTTLLYHVDAFARAPFRGNPAAVVLLDEERPDDWMQSVAAEMNVSETAFARPLPDGSFSLRWFTPGTEVPLCGHATLATGAVLLSEKVVSGAAIFQTASGPLMVEPHEQGYALSLPSLATEPIQAPELQALLNVATLDLRASRTGRTYLVRVTSQEVVQNLQFSFLDLFALPNPLDLQGLIVTAAVDDPGPEDPHFVSRYFAPWVGIPEDPVTGSAHAVLGPYWGERLGLDRMRARQLSARGGDLLVELDLPRVVLVGGCVLLSRGFWLA